MKSTSLNR